MSGHRTKKKADGPFRAALYLRVSTGAQAKRDLSLPDQRRQLREYCDGRGWSVAAEFEDARTGTNANRPDFQRMMDTAVSGDATFDFIVVHSYSRFFRDEIETELCIRSLAKRGIRLISATQDFEDSPLGEMVRRIMGLFDEYDSKETGKHVSRALAENARQGYFNGGVVPYGFKAVAVEQRGDTRKKKLFPRDDEAENVRLFFDLYLKGDGSSGPLGVKKVVEWLNDHGYRTRKGAKWGIGPMHRTLKDSIYKGEYWRNRNGEEADRILIEVPPIVTAEVFDTVQQVLVSRNPKVTPPRTVSGPILLSGLATCASCGSGMLISTGKSGKYRYYACGGRVRQGKGTCDGRRVRMAETDNLVIEAITKDMLTPKRMTKILEALQKRQTTRDGKKAAGLSLQQDRLTDAETRLRRLIEAIENGLMDVSDPTFKQRVDTVRSERDIAKKAVANALAELSPEAKLTEDKISDFVDVMRNNLTNGEIPARRAYLRAVVDNIEIDDTEIRIHGRKDKPTDTVFKRKNGTNSVGSATFQMRRMPFPTIGVQKEKAAS
jgi:site-specific DNA recombinase